LTDTNKRALLCVCVGEMWLDVVTSTEPLLKRIGYLGDGSIPVYVHYIYGTCLFEKDRVFM
jgi:hypothetical protein